MLHLSGQLGRNGCGDRVKSLRTRNKRDTVAPTFIGALSWTYGYAFALFVVAVVFCDLYVHKANRFDELAEQAALLNYIVAGYFASGRVPGRMGSAHPSIVPYQVFET